MTKSLWAQSKKLSIFGVVVLALAMALAPLTGLVSINRADAVAFGVDRVQHDFEFAADPTATFSSTPTEGNLLIASVFSRTGGSSANHMISGSGWEKRVARDTLLGNSSHRRALTVWTKTAGPGEPTTVTVTGDNANQRRVVLLIQEFTSHADGEFTFIDATSNDDGNASNSGSSLSTGSTVSTVGDVLAVSVFGVRNGSGTNINSVNWDNGGDDVHRNGGGNRPTHNSAWSTDDTAGPKTDTATWDGSNSGASAALLVFAAPDMCSLPDQPGRIIVDMWKYRFIRSDSSFDPAAIHGPFDVNLPEGKYQVTLHSWDNHSRRVTQPQDEESWFIELSDSGGNLVATSNAISDLPDADNFITEVVNGELELTSDVTELLAVHAAWPTNNPNSIYPICVAFDPIEEDEPDDGQVLGTQVTVTPTGSVDAGEGAISSTSAVALIAVVASAAIAAKGALAIVRKN